MHSNNGLDSEYTKFKIQQIAVLIGLSVTILLILWLIIFIGLWLKRKNVPD